MRAWLVVALCGACTPTAGTPPAMTDAEVLADAHAVCARASALGCSLGESATCAQAVAGGLRYGSTTPAVLECAANAGTAAALTACGAFFTGACLDGGGP